MGGKETEVVDLREGMEGMQGWDWKVRVLDEMVRNEAQQIEPSSNYSKPDVRSRATGSIV